MCVQFRSVSVFYRILNDVFVFASSYLDACVHSSYRLKVIRGSGSSLRYDFRAPVYKQDKTEAMRK